MESMEYNLFDYLDLFFVEVLSSKGIQGHSRCNYYRDKLKCCNQSLFLGTVHRPMSLNVNGVSFSSPLYLLISPLLSSKGGSILIVYRYLSGLCGLSTVCCWHYLFTTQAFIHKYSIWCEIIMGFCLVTDVYHWYSTESKQSPEQVIFNPDKSIERWIIVRFPPSAERRDRVLSL